GRLGQAGRRRGAARHRRDRLDADRPGARRRARHPDVQRRAAPPRGAVRITGVRTFVVGNPTPGYGGRYFIFLKLESDGGLEGVGEVYAATVSPQLVALWAGAALPRRVVGREPFHVEATWRDVYASGYAMRPD